MNIFKLAFIAIAINVAVAKVSGPKGNAKQGEKCIQQLEDILDKIPYKSVNVHFPQRMGLSKLQQKINGIGVLIHANKEHDCKKADDFEAFKALKARPANVAHKIDFIKNLYTKIHAYHVAVDKKESNTKVKKLILPVFKDIKECRRGSSKKHARVTAEGAKGGKTAAGGEEGGDEGGEEGSEDGGEEGGDEDELIYF